MTNKDINNKGIKNRIISLLSVFKEMSFLPAWVVLFIDITFSVFSFTLAYLISYQLLEVPVQTGLFLIKLLINTVIICIFFYIFKPYSAILRYSTYTDALKIFNSLLCSNIAFYLINMVLEWQTGKKIFLNLGFIINFSLAFFCMFSFRMFVKLTYDYLNRRSIPIFRRLPVMVYGVDPPSVSLANMIRANKDFQYFLAGFISTNTNATNKRLLGVPVYAGDQLEYLLKKGSLQKLIINSSELSTKDKQQIVDICLINNVQILSPPPASEWVDGTPKLDEMKNIQIEDLLGRNPIQISTEAIKRDVEGKCILLTGAAGSIGSEIVRQLSRFKPGLLILCDIAETPMHQLQLELQENFPELNFKAVICDVRNISRLETLFKTYHPKLVYHAAAYKHVPLMEEHPSEAVITNVSGTKNLADLSLKYEVDAFVMVSTDKAVNPTNVMGASKRIAEIYVQSLSSSLSASVNNKNIPRYITTRFGNVLGSNGSVIPRFREQIAKGGPVTVTHPDIIRYFMTIPEACQLVLEAGHIGKGGEIFVFDMGEATKIIDLAEKMIRLAGYIPNKDIMIKITGLRPGEKLYEELLNQEENTQPTHHGKIMIGAVRIHDYAEVCESLDSLFSFAKKHDDPSVVQWMKTIVPEYISINSHWNDTKSFPHPERSE